MTEKIIVIDCLGADEGAGIVITGAAKALENIPELSIALVGPKETIETKLKELNADMSRVEIIDAPDLITNYENPMAAIMAKPNSSLVKSLQLVGTDDKYIGIGEVVNNKLKRKIII